MAIGRGEVFRQFAALLPEVRKDWDPNEEITDQMSLLGDMNWRSIELIALAHRTQEHYQQVFPFNDLFAQVMQRKTRDLSVSEWVDFIHAHLNSGTVPPASNASAVGLGSSNG
jgi:hypothetical protein